jgi:hypothetical protein
LQKQQELRREAASDALSAARDQCTAAQRDHAAAMTAAAEQTQRAAALRAKVPGSYPSVAWLLMGVLWL